LALKKAAIALLKTDIVLESRCLFQYQSSSIHTDHRHVLKKSILSHALGNIRLAQMPIIRTIFPSKAILKSRHLTYAAKGILFVHGYPKNLYSNSFYSAVPHQKFFLMSVASSSTSSCPEDWNEERSVFYFGSHNESYAAWGYVDCEGKLKIRLWDTGILFRVDAVSQIDGYSPYHDLSLGQNNIEHIEE
jgi:hypothetical protein